MRSQPTLAEAGTDFSLGQCYKQPLLTCDLEGNPRESNFNYKSKERARVDGLPERTTENVLIHMIVPLLWTWGLHPG